MSYYPPRRPRRPDPKVAAANAERFPALDAFKTYLVDNPGVHVSDFLLDVFDKSYRYDLSDKAGNAFTKAFDRHLAREAERAAAAPVVAGNGLDVSGVVVSVKWKDGPFPGYKMTVKADNGSVVWGTVPSSLLDAVDELGSLVGLRVAMVANVVASDRDPSFGFFKRPRNARLDYEPRNLAA